MSATKKRLISSDRVVEKNGRYYILAGHPGYGLHANNRKGWPSPDYAHRASMRCEPPSECDEEVCDPTGSMLMPIGDYEGVSIGLYVQSYCGLCGYGIGRGDDSPVALISAENVCNGESRCLRCFAEEIGDRLSATHNLCDRSAKR